MMAPAHITTATQIVQSYSPGGTRVHLYLIKWFLGPQVNLPQMASPPVQSFLQSSQLFPTSSYTPIMPLHCRNSPHDTTACSAAVHK